MSTKSPNNEIVEQVSEEERREQDAETERIKASGGCVICRSMTPGKHKFTCPASGVERPKIPAQMDADGNLHTKDDPIAITGLTALPLAGGTSSIVLHWSWVGKGFGRLTFYVRNGNLYAHTEGMSDESVRAIVTRLATQAIVVN